MSMTTERNESVSVAVHAAVHTIGCAVDEGTMTWDAAVERLTAAFPAINLRTYSTTLHTLDHNGPHTAFATVMWAYADALTAIGAIASDAAFANFMAAVRSGDASAIAAARRSAGTAWDEATANAERVALAVLNAPSV